LALHPDLKNEIIRSAIKVLDNATVDPAARTREGHPPAATAAANFTKKSSAVFFAALLIRR
jgi:hypothetical protein